MKIRILINTLAVWFGCSIFAHADDFFRTKYVEKSEVVGLKIYGYCGGIGRISPPRNPIPRIAKFAAEFAVGDEDSTEECDSANHELFPPNEKYGHLNWLQISCIDHLSARAFSTLIRQIPEGHQVHIVFLDCHLDSEIIDLCMENPDIVLHLQKTKVKRLERPRKE